MHTNTPTAFGAARRGEVMAIIVRMYSGPAPRKKPQAGDEKTVKGVVMIRQQVRSSYGWHVSNGKPVWEWVVKGSEKDRRAKRQEGE